MSRGCKRSYEKETLVGKEQKATDAVINSYTIHGTNAQAKDTGLYELYENVVEKFVNKMIQEGERYAGIGHPGVHNEILPIDNWVARTGKGPGQHGAPSGMSYSYGGFMNISMFNDATRGVSRWKAAPNEAIQKNPPNEDDDRFYQRVLKDYRGNIDETDGGIDNTANDNDPVGDFKRLFLVVISQVMMVWISAPFS